MYAVVKNKRTFFTMAIRAKICSIKDIHLMFVVFVIMITRSEVVGSEFRLSDSVFMPDYSFDELAQEVCNVLQEEGIPECIKQFLRPPNAAWLPPEVRGVEWIKKSVMFNVTRSDLLQLVLLVPDEGNTIVTYLGIGAVSGEAVIIPGKRYTFWTTVMAPNGTHSAWREGPKLDPWRPTQGRKYTVKIDEDYDNSSNVRVDFRWSSSGDVDDILQEDTMYMVAIGCMDKEPIDNIIEIKAGKVPSYSANVSPGDKCTFTVVGPDGGGEWQYNAAPQPVENISVFATPSGAGWDVSVRWNPPARAPRGYQVVLLATNYTANVTVTGNTTSAMFRDVVGRGEYDVTVTAMVGDYGNSAAVSAVFPSK